MGVYKHIKDGVIIDSRETIDELLISKLIAKEWLPYIIQEEPEYNIDTQYLTSEPIINETNVVETYIINDYTSEELDERLSIKREMLLNTINDEVNTYINTYYDTGTQQTFTAIYTQQNTPTSIKDYLDPVLVWISSIMSYYYGRKQNIIDATDITTLKAITWDFTTFDTTKPDVSLQALMTLLSE
jgi:hypothetical protein